MKGKLTMLAGLGIGYVLGTKAGRARYEQIKRNATKLWQDPRVQEKKGQAAHLAKEQGAVAKEKLQEKAHEVQDRMHAHSGSAASGGSSVTGGSGGPGPAADGNVPPTWST